jgi:APA family basic amino acid/polyamine antiporter
MDNNFYLNSLKNQGLQMHNASEKKDLLRSLGLLPATMLVAGSMIGSGIFRKPSTMAGQVGMPELLIGVWIVAGIISFIGALSNAEVAGFIDATGGQYTYFRKMYGDFVAFLYGWSILAVIQTGSQAAIAYVFGEYLGYFIKYPSIPLSLQNFSFHLPVLGDLKPLAEFGPKLIAISAILFLTIINYIGVKFGGAVQTLVTSIKISSILALAFLLITLGDGSSSNIVSQFQPAAGFSGNMLTGFGLALAGAFWAYEGWNNVTFISGEVKNPRVNIPRALMFGTVIVIAVYVLINIAYLYILPIEDMAKSKLVAADAASKIFGQNGGTIISIAVLISTFGALNGSILSTARVQFAMSRDKLFFSGIGKVHPRFGTPHVSLAVQGIWSCLLVMSGTFDTITDYVIFAAWLFYMLGAFGVFVLRKKMPNTFRPYKVWGYPYSTMVFVIFSFLFLLNTVISDTSNAAMGALLILSGIPFYFYWKNKQKIQEKEPVLNE